MLGSPRSETSILAWCLGGAPEHYPTPGVRLDRNLAIDLAVRYQIGTARGERSVLSAMDIQREEFFANFGQSVNY